MFVCVEFNVHTKYIVRRQNYKEFFVLEQFSLHVSSAGASTVPLAAGAILHEVLPGQLVMLQSASYREKLMIV